jgi:hypothetical protein
MARIEVQPCAAIANPGSRRRAGWPSPRRESSPPISSPGRRSRSRAWPAGPEIAAAEGTFDYRAYLSHLGIYYTLQAASEQDWRVVASPSKPPLADRFREWARRALALGLPVEDESLRLEWALTLGWKTALTEEVSEPFVQAATYHIFAVDGLRMAIIFGIFFYLFRALRLPRAVCGLVLIPLIWFYVGSRAGRPPPFAPPSC